MESSIGTVYAFSDLIIIQIWSVNYSLRFRSVNITNIVYIGVYLVQAYIERSFFICLLLSKLFLLVSKLH